MSYFRICPNCGANLDPGEFCDCRDKETAQSTANTPGGKVEHVVRDDVSTSTITEKRR